MRTMNTCNSSYQNNMLKLSILFCLLAFLSHYNLQWLCLLLFSMFCFIGFRKQLFLNFVRDLSQERELSVMLCTNLYILALFYMRQGVFAGQTRLLLMKSYPILFLHSSLFVLLYFLTSLLLENIVTLMVKRNSLSQPDTWKRGYFSALSTID